MRFQKKMWGIISFLSLFALASQIVIAGTPGTLKWVFDTGGAVDSPTIGSDGTIYIGSDKLYAVNPDGTVKWAFESGDSIRSPAIGANEILYAGSYSYSNWKNPRCHRKQSRTYV